jgi:exopolyphosphatase/guanosine-5'-triphosphate,3'-diphosphate pyrophosphatase
MDLVRVAIIDVGANTLRLLVAGPSGRHLVSVHEEREQLGLGEEVERYGYLSDAKVARAVQVAREQTRKARQLGCERVQIVVTSPGRQSANGEDFVDALGRAAGVPTRILTAEEEGALAWEGAVSALDEIPESIAVCDVGGGSTQLIVGTRDEGPGWVRSVDLGSLRLTERILTADPSAPEAVAAARAEVAEAFSEVVPPVAKYGLATGGTARALRRVTGGVLDSAAIESAIGELSQVKRAKVAKRFGVAPQRASTLLAGALLFAEAQRRLGVALEPARGGVREGSAQALFRESASAYG